MPRDPYQPDGAGHAKDSAGVDLWCCPFCEHFEASDLLIDPMGTLKAHVLSAHPTDYHAVMNAVDATMAERDRLATQMARDHAAGALAGRRN